MTEIKRLHTLIAFIVGSSLWMNAAFAETLQSVTTSTEHATQSSVFTDSGPVHLAHKISAPVSQSDKSYTVSNTAPYTNGLDRLAYLMENSKTPLSDFTPDWLDLEIEHRTRYEGFDNGFNRAITDRSDNHQIHQRTRFLIGINRDDPLSLTFELTDMRASYAEHGQEKLSNFANHFDITQLHIDMKTDNFFRTGLPGKLEVGRIIMDFGKGRLVAGHRFGPLTPTFDGVQLTVGSDKQGWGVRVFGTSPVKRFATELDDFSPVTFFSGAQVTNRDYPWANVDLYFFQLNEGNKLKKRNISTPGFRLFAKPSPGHFDYEIESMYQFGDVNDVNYFAHRHHGEIGYSFNTKMPLRLTYLFDFASGSRDPNKNFDFLFAKRRGEYGPTGILGVFFPSNIMSPAGFRATLSPIPTVRLMMAHRAYWLANKKGAFARSGMQDPTGRSGGFLGNLFELNLRWDPQYSYMKRMSFDIGYAHLFKGDYFDKVPNTAGGQDTNYGYTMVTFKF